MAEEVQIAEAAERFAVAMRMLKFEARTRTIRLATRLSEDQIRRLVSKSKVSMARHRGRSPSSAQQYTRNFAAQLESSIFCGVLIKHALLKGHRPKPWLHNGLQYAWRFCDAYAEYLNMAHETPLNFEQGWYLSRVLAARGELYLQRCAQCISHFVRDAATVLKGQCPLCQLRDQGNERAAIKAANEPLLQVRPPPTNDLNDL